MIPFVAKAEQVLYYNGYRFFYSGREMSSNLPCKIYSINEHFESVTEDYYHDYIQILYVSKGELIHCVNNRRHKMVKGNLFIIPPFSVHRIETTPGNGYEIIGCEFMPGFINDRYGQLPLQNDFFDYAYLEQFLTTDDKVKSQITLTGNVDYQVNQLLREMNREFNARKPYYELMIKGNLLKLLSIIIRAYREEEVREMIDKSDKFRPLIAAAIDYIHQNYNKEIRLDHACKIALLSKTRFCDLFKQFTGRTYNDYLIELRIEKATELLARSDLSIAEVCFQVGLGDVTYFSRMFKKYTGVSPSYYKKHAVRVKTNCEAKTVGQP